MPITVSLFVVSVVSSLSSAHAAQRTDQRSSLAWKSARPVVESTYDA